MKSNKTLLQYVRLCLIVAFQFAISLQFTFAQSDVSVGTSYNLNIQRPNSFGDAFLLHNASFSASEDVLQWATSHPSFGSRGIRFAYGADKGIFFYASESSTTAGSTFQPTPRFFIGNHGRVGVNTVKPKANLEVNGGFLSGNTLASPNLYDHTIVRADANVAFEGGQIFINSETPTANGFKFSVAGSSNPSPLFRIGVVNAASPNQYDIDYLFMGNDKVGVGLTNPSTKLEVNGTISMVRGNKLQFNETIGGAPRASIGSDGTNHLLFHVGSGSGTDAMIIDPSGNIGVGIMAPHHKLDVNGIIHSKEVVVDLNNWPDYVFDSTYVLPPLSQVEEYIKTNKHLPEIPSEAEVKENGVAVGEMNALLLKKIEELTLYLLEQKKLIEAQNELIKNQSKRIELIEEKL